MGRAPWAGSTLREKVGYGLVGLFLVSVWFFGWLPDWWKWAFSVIVVLSVVALMVWGVREAVRAGLKYCLCIALGLFGVLVAFGAWFLIAVSVRPVALGYVLGLCAFLAVVRVVIAIGRVLDNHVTGPKIT